MIGLAYRDSLPEGTAQELDQLTAGLTGMLYQEHDPDGTHTNITADSLTINKPDLTNGVAGTIVFKDRLGFVSTISRNDTGDAILTLANGYRFVVKRTDLSGTLYSLAALGLITYGGSSGNGIALFGLDADNNPLPNTFKDWAFVSGNTNAAPGGRMEIANMTDGLSPISLRYRSGVTTYEWMKTTGGSGPTTETVNLGSGLDSSQAGYWDNLYVKSITLGNGAGPSGNVIGTWTDVAFSAGNFTANGAMTWTLTSGDQATFAYMIVGNTMFVDFALSLTSVGGTPNIELRVAIPLGFSVSGRTFDTVGYAVDNGVLVPMTQLQAANGNSYISIYRQDGTAWSASTNATSVRGQIHFSIS